MRLNFSTDGLFTCEKVNKCKHTNMHKLFRKQLRVNQLNVLFVCLFVFALII